MLGKKALVIEATAKQSNGLVVITPVMTLGKKTSKSSVSERPDMQPTWVVGK